MGQKKGFSLEYARKKLSGSRFRDLNEKLYMQYGEDSFKLFTENPQLFITVSTPHK